MSQATATTTAGPTAKPPLWSNLAVQPGDVLLHLIVTLLTPMFLGVSSGNPDFARMAALETVNSYRARSYPDLIAVAGILAFGLAAISSACLSMADEVSLTMTLRLRANANACDRSAARNRRALQNNQDSPMPDLVFAPDRPTDPVPDPEADRKDAEAIARLAATRQRAEALLRTHPSGRRSTPGPTNPTPTVAAAPRPAVADAPAPAAAAPVEPAAAAADAALTAAAPTTAAIAAAIAVATSAAPNVTPTAAIATASAAAANQPPIAARIAAPVTTAAPHSEVTDQQIQQLWAAAMGLVAEEYATELANLPPAERDAARARVEVLSKAAGDLMSGKLPPRARPGDLGTAQPNRR